MAKILVIPDVHGTHQWEVVKSFPKESYDYIVFIGDYFDAWQNIDIIDLAFECDG